MGNPGRAARASDGRETWNYTQYANADAFLIDWHNATAPTFAQRASADRRHLHWTLPEVSALFQKLHTGWRDEGIAVLAASGKLSRRVDGGQSVARARRVGSSCYSRRPDARRDAAQSPCERDHCFRG